jgi:hypothetical protein
VRQIVIATRAVTTLAGAASLSTGVGVDGVGTAATFDFPQGITSDGVNLYVTDNGSFTVRRIVIATGAVTTLAQGPSAEGIATDGAGNLFVAYTATLTVAEETAAGFLDGGLIWSAGQPIYAGSTDGSVASALFNYPYGVVYDGRGNLFVTDTYNAVIRQIAIAAGQVTTLAGTAGQTGAVDGVGAAARFNFPVGIASDGTNLYVADLLNATIRQIVIATGQVTTLAGAGVKRERATASALRRGFPHRLA